MSRPTEIKNARITKTSLGYEDHGMMSCMVFVDGAGWGGGFGGYRLDTYDNNAKKSVGTAYGLEFICRVLKAVGVDSWEALVGKPVRVETEGAGGRILRIGHFMEDKWFDPAELAKDLA